MSKEKYQVEAATLYDVADVASMIVDLLASEGEKVSDEQRKAIIKDVLANVMVPQKVFLVAVVYKKKKRIVCGYVSFEVQPHPYGKIIGWGDNLFVKPDYRDGEAAKMLVETAEHVGAGMGAVEVIFTTKHPKYFEKYGYELSEYQVKKSLNRGNL